MSKSKILIIIGILALIAGLFLVFSTPGKDELRPQEVKKLGGFDLARCTGGLTGTSTQRVTAEGTHYYVEENNANFITANATSTIQCQIGNADLIDINFFFVGSTTGAYLTWDYEFSFDGLEWFAPTIFTDQADNNTLVGTSTYAFIQNNGVQPGLEGTTTLNVDIEPLAAQFIRLNMGAGGAAASVYAEIINRNQY